MDKTLQIQTQIRQNAEEISSALSSMSQWEKQMKARDTNIKVANEKAARVPRAPIRSGVGTVPVQVREETVIKKDKSDNSASSLWQTPSSIVAPKAAQPAKATPVIVPSARGNYQDKDLEEFERERGNAEFKVGNFTAAVKSYTKCLGLKGRNFVAFSNRAMAYLKLKEYARAVSDCTCALQIEPAHVKSLLRRSTAYNAVGKHRAALRDLLSAAALEPTNKQVRMDLMSTKEQLRNAVSRAPLVPVFPLSQLLLGQGQAAASSVGGARGDVGVASVNVGVGAGVGAAVASLQLQGPDPRPPNFVEPAVVVEQNGYNISSSSGIGDVETSVAVPAPPSPPPISSAPQGTSAAAVVQAAAGVSTGATTRVSITFEDDEEEGEQEVRELEMGEEAERRVSLQDTTSTPAPSKAAVSTPNKVSTAVAAAAASVTAVPVAVLPAPVAKTPGSCSKKNAKHHSTETNKNPTEVAVQIQSCYDLERELRIAAGDMNMLKTLFKAFKTSQLKSVLKNLSEPTVLHMLLMAVYRYFCSAKKQQFDKVCKWYAAVGAVPRFVMQYALLSEEYKVELRGVLATMASAITAAEDRNSSNDEVLQKIQDLQDIF